MTFDFEEIDPSLFCPHYLEKLKIERWMNEHPGADPYRVFPQYRKEINQIFASKFE